MKRILVATLTAFLLSPGGATAEPTDTEQRIREAVRKQPTSNVIFMEIKLREEGRELRCYDGDVTVVSDEGFSTWFFTEKPSSILGQGAFSGGVTFLPPGTYTVVSVRCKSTARLNGKFARFRVGADEIINTGCLVIDFKKGPEGLFSPRTFTGQTSVEGLGAKAVESLTERTPTILPRATKRYMTPNPATSGKRPS